MLKTLRLLLVEDSQDDADILLRVLLRDGYDVFCHRVQSAGEMRDALENEVFDLVISDYSMPRFSGPGALTLFREIGIDLPFIVVSGAVGEESAVALLKAGAHDFLVKGRLARLGAVIEREMREAHGRAERRRAQEALRQSESKYRRIVETAKEGIWVTNPDGVTTYVNGRMADLLGCTPEAIIGTNIRDHVDETARPAIAACHTGSSVSELHDVEFRRADGTRFVSRLSTSGLTDDQRESGVLFMVTDTTEQRKLTAQLLVSDRMYSVGMLAAGVAHEINNPLAALIGNFDMMDASIAKMPLAVQASLESHQFTERMANAREAAERVREIARDLRMYSRADDDRQEQIDLQPVIESAIRMAWTEISPRARVTRDFRPVPGVYASASRLGQVFLNLLVNAAQAIPDNATQTNEIFVALRPDAEGSVVVEIRDTGEGMSPEIMNQLFTPFFTTKEAPVGTGLGLSICQRIVTGMNGMITVESTPGAGSTFRVTLPASAPANDNPVPAGKSAPGTNGRQSVLVIDDEPAIVTAIKRMLHGIHDVSGYSSAGQALADIRGGARFDMILCDLMMPEMTGMALHAAITGFAPEQARHMLFLTGGAFTPRTVAFLAQDGIRHIEKPFDKAVLLKAIDELTVA